MRDLWLDIQPGDVGFDRGVGISGWVIRTGTQTQFGHCWVYHCRNADGSWQTVEAGPRGGLMLRTRTVAPNKVVRMWAHETEQQAMLAMSVSLLGSKYGWGEIARIVARILGLKVRRGKDHPKRVLCPKHFL
jgi:hypothetical protein